MDRALLYIKQQLDRLVIQVKSRTTKGLGDSYYDILRFRRESASLCSMSGDVLLAETIATTLEQLNSRTPCKTALTALQELSSRVSSYEPIQDLDDVQGLRERIATLEAQITDEPEEEQKVLDTSQADSVFVIMPFSPDFGDVWKGGIEKAAKAEGFNPIRVDMINKSTNITDDIVGSIERCRLAIVDVTGNNPNVMFELGYTLAKKKTNIIISQSADDLPFDIRNIRTIIYSNTWSGVEVLRGKVQSFLRESGAKPKTRAKKAAKKKSASK